MARAIQRTCILLSLALLLILASGLFFTPKGQQLTRVYGPQLKSYYNDLSPSTTIDDSLPPLSFSGGKNWTATAAADEPIMDKLLNETLKAELGRHAWYLFHTVLARYPDSPTTAERDDLGQYVKYFVKLYPCGDCAAHFQGVIQRMPLQSSSRLAAAQWGCAVHNVVNKRLGKSEYDCSKILEDYDCGCGNSPTS